MPHDLTRRELNARLLAAAGLAAAGGSGWLLSVRSVSAQPRVIPKKDKNASQQSKPGAPVAGVGGSVIDDLFKRGRTHDWVLKVSIHLDSYQDPNVYTLPGRPATTPPAGPGAGTPNPYINTPTIIPFKFETAAVVFPAIRSTATSQADSDPTATLKMDMHEVGSTPTWIENLPCGARYGRWDMKDLAGRAIDFDVELPITTWEVMFDEVKASKAIWPKSGNWPDEAKSTFVPQLGVDIGSPFIHDTLTKWCNGKPPQEVPPVQLAKYLASKVLETLQPSGDGLVSSRTGLLQGFNLQGAELTLKEGRGSEHDIAGVLCSLYRMAGLPARLVIGWDVSESKGQNVGLKRKKGGDLRSWVEFCLYDETATTAAPPATPGGPPGPVGPRAVWVPVDVWRMRRSSSVAPALNSKWKYFGNHDETDDIIPIAFHYHPPLVGAIAHGSPCFWGWMTTPEMQTAEQTIRFTTITASKTAPSPGGR